MTFADVTAKAVGNRFLWAVNFTPHLDLTSVQSGVSVRASFPILSFSGGDLNANQVSHQYQLGSDLVFEPRRNKAPHPRSRFQPTVSSTGVTPCARRSLKAFMLGTLTLSSASLSLLRFVGVGVEVQKMKRYFVNKTRAPLTSGCIVFFRWALAAFHNARCGVM